MVLQSLPTRRLGNDGPEVPTLGFGMAELCHGYIQQAPPDEERFRLLDRAWELGTTFWDTAAGYGDCEALIGQWFKKHPERRKDIFLATKFGMGAVVQRDGSKRMSVDSSPENCLSSCERSLENLGTECIDLFYVHRFDKITPVERMMEAMVKLKSKGKIKYIGLSECSSNTLRRAYAVHPISAVQVEYHPWALDIENDAGTDLLSTCRTLGVAVVCYSPLGRGALTGRFRSLDDFEKTDARHTLPRFSPENFAKNVQFVKVFEDLAARKGCTPAQVVLAWIMAQGPDLFPIPGTRTLKYLEQNAGCVSVNVSQEENMHVREALVKMGGPSGDKTLAAANAFANTPPL